MDTKLFKAINYTLKDLKSEQDTVEGALKNTTDKEMQEFFKGEKEGLQKGIDLIERILSDYEKRVKKQ